MRFGFFGLMAAIMGSTSLSSCDRPSGRTARAVEYFAPDGSSGLVKGGSYSPIGSKRSATSKKKKSNRKRLSHNAKLKRRRAK